VELMLTNVFDFSKEKIFEARRSSPYFSEGWEFFLEPLDTSGISKLTQL
jgi:hypothetical protein